MYEKKEAVVDDILLTEECTKLEGFTLCNKSFEDADRWIGRPGMGGLRIDLRSGYTKDLTRVLKDYMCLLLVQTRLMGKDLEERGYKGGIYTKTNMTWKGIKNRFYRKSDVPCLCSQRWILAYLGFLFGMIFSMYRIDMSMAVVCMVRDDANNVITVADNGSDVTDILIRRKNISEELLSDLNVSSGGCEGEISNNVQQNHNAEFTWDKRTQSVVLSAFFYGFVTTQIPGGWFIVRYGGKNVITTSLALSSSFMIAIPVLARRHVIGVIVARILTGVVSGPLPPAWFALLGKWALPNERGRMMMMFWIGQTAGSAIGITTSGLLCAHGFDNGWGSIFYLHGITGLTFVIFWVYLAASSPNTHPRITKGEKLLIAKYLNTSTTTNEKVDKIPWVKIFANVTVWSIFLTQLCDNWSYYLMLTCLPMFVNEILKLDIQRNGFYSSLPFITTVLSLLTSGVIADYLNKRRWVSRTTNRKIFQITSLIGSSVFLIISCYLPCDRKELVILCISMCTFFLHIAYASGYPCNIVDMSPRYDSCLYAISNTIGASTGFLAPLAVGFLTKHKSIEEWRFVFWISGGIACIGAIIYGLFSTSELLPFDPAYSHSLEMEISEKKPMCDDGKQEPMATEMTVIDNQKTEPLKCDNT